MCRGRFAEGNDEEHAPRRFAEGTSWPVARMRKGSRKLEQCPSKFVGNKNQRSIVRGSMSHRSFGFGRSDAELTEWTLRIWQAWSYETAKTRAFRATGLHSTAARPTSS